MKAPDFHLLGVDGKRHDLAAVRGPNGLVVMFICNHCPYVKAVIDRIVRDCGELSAQGDGSVAVMSNDPDRKSTRLNSSHGYISYAVFCLKKKKKKQYCADAVQMHEYEPSDQL